MKGRTEMIDNFGRTIDYIRISVTDRCNFRCRYCMPEGGAEMLSQKELLTFDEIRAVCQAGIRLGIRNVKLTGGEPLLRRNLAVLAAMLNNLKGIGGITMTSNGLLLGECAAGLKAAGLSAVNVSLDTLDRERFMGITGTDGLNRVLEGMDRAAEAGLLVKVNCTVSSATEREDILGLAGLSMERDIPVRFIEMMPVGLGSNYPGMAKEEVLTVLRGVYAGIKPQGRKLGNGPAEYYSLEGEKGCVGFISAVHHKFCPACNRVRMTADGFLKLCLDGGKGVDLKAILRSPQAGSGENCGSLADTDRIGRLSGVMEEHIREKPACHHFESGKSLEPGNMNRIGG